MPRFVSRKAKTLGMQHLLFLGVGVSSTPQDRGCVVRHRTGGLLEEQYTDLDGQATAPVKQGVKAQHRLKNI